MYRWAVVVASLSILLALGSWAARVGAAAPGPLAPAPAAPVTVPSASAVSGDAAPPAANPAPIPEPATLAFLAFGSLTLVAIRRRRAGR